MSEVVASENVKFEERRQAWLDRYSDLYLGWTAPVSKTIANPTVPARAFERLDKLKRYQYVDPSLDFILGTAATIFLSFFAFVVFMSFTLPILVALGGTGFTVFRAVRDKRGLTNFIREANRLPQQDFVVLGVDGEIFEHFTHAVKTCRELEPSVNVVEHLAEIEDLFFSLTLNASEFHEKDLNQSSGAIENREQRVRLTAEACALRDVMKDRYSMRVALESVASVQAVERAKAFKGLAAPAAEMEEERSYLSSYLKELG